MKALGYRLLATGFTVGAMVALTGRADIAAAFGLLDFFGKAALFYVYDSIWEGA